MGNSLELTDDSGDSLRALRVGKSTIRLAVTDDVSARYYLDADQRLQLAMFLLDGLEGGDADSAKTKLTGAEYAELSSLISRNALNRAISAAESITTTRVDHAVDAIQELYDQLG